MLPPPLPDPGSHQLKQQQHAQPGHEKDPVPLKRGSGPFPVTAFAEARSGAHLDGEPQNPYSPAQPGSPSSQIVSWHRYGLHFLVDATRILPPSKSGKYLGSILEHVVGERGLHVSVCGHRNVPRIHVLSIQALSSSWMAPSQNMALCRCQAMISSAPTDQGPPFPAAAALSPCSQLGRAGERGVRAACLALGHAPSLAHWGRLGEEGGRGEMNKNRSKE